MIYNLRDRFANLYNPCRYIRYQSGSVIMYSDQIFSFELPMSICSDCFMPIDNHSLFCHWYALLFSGFSVIYLGCYTILLKIAQNL